MVIPGAVIPSVYNCGYLLMVPVHEYLKTLLSKGSGIDQVHIRGKKRERKTGMKEKHPILYLHENKSENPKCCVREVKVEKAHNMQKTEDER